MLRARAQGGFTLLELLLVLVIAAASYALVVRFSAGGVSGAELRSAARTVAAGLRDARGTAIASQAGPMVATIFVLCGRSDILPPDLAAHSICCSLHPP